MPPKKDKKESEKSEGKEKVKQQPAKGGAVLCGSRGPGPKYKLKNLVGYIDHDATKYLYPAYTFRRRQTGYGVCDGPGPKYLTRMDRFGPRMPPAYTFGYAATSAGSDCTPGPKYMVRGTGPSPPAYTLKSRTNYRHGSGTPGPYNVTSPRDGPAFSMAMRPIGGGCGGSPGPKYNDFDMNVTKPRAPMYSLAYKQTGGISCNSPGPKYLPRIGRPNPKYSFGIKHSECAPPLIVECDEVC